MDGKQFREWLAAHCTAFPGLDKWFKDQPAGKAATVSLWYQSLKLISPQGASSATKRMHGSTDLAATPWSQHPAKIRELTSKSGTGNQSFYADCMCKGTGLVEVYTDGKFKTALGNPIRSETTFVICKCNLGSHIYDRQGGHDPDGRERPRMSVFHDGLRVYGIDDRKPEPLIATGWDSLPSYQGSFYEPKGIDD